VSVTALSTSTGLADWGPLVIGSDVDNAILGALKTWAPTYLTQIRTERGLTFQPAIPRVYANTFAGQEFFDHQLPAVICMTAQLAVTRGGSDRTYEGTWASRLATVIRAKSPPATRFMAGLYEGVFRRLVTQKARGNPINDLHYLGYVYEEVPDATGQGRYCLAAVSRFEVYSDQVVQPYGGPNIPDATQYLGGANVTEIDLDVLGETVVVTSGVPNVPTLTAVSPNAGAVASTVTLTLTGTALDSVTRVALRNPPSGVSVYPNSWQILSATSITATWNANSLRALTYDVAVWDSVGHIAERPGGYVAS
jgi:hypothetical protein